jgi:hypothetical protein
MGGERHDIREEDQILLPVLIIVVNPPIIRT